MPSIVRIADPRGSTPSPLTLAAVVLGSLVLGVLLLKLSLVAPRPDAATLAPQAEGDELGSGEDDELAGAQEAAATDAGTANAVEAVAEAPAPPPAPEAVPAAEAPAPTGEAGAARELVHGRVAYFQCPNDSCPRDHGLERSIWRALDRLGVCLGNPGEADVRVSVQAGAVTDVRFRERGAAGIDLGVLNRCVSPPLTRVTGSTLPDGAVVSFRFELR